MESKYTVREVDGARNARQQLKTMGYMSRDDMVNMIGTGKIINSTCTIKDVMRS